MYRPRGTTSELMRRQTDGVSRPFILGLGYGWEGWRTKPLPRGFYVSSLARKRSGKVYPSPWVAGTGWSQFALLPVTVIAMAV